MSERTVGGAVFERLAKTKEVVDSEKGGVMVGAEVLCEVVDPATAENACAGTPDSAPLIDMA